MEQFKSLKNYITFQLKNTNSKVKSFKRAFVDFCNKTTIAGYRNVSRKELTLIERILWFCFNTIVFVISVHIIKISWDSLEANPTVTTLDNQTYDIRNIRFPGVAVCNINQMSRKNTFEYAKFL